MFSKNYCYKRVFPSALVAIIEFIPITLFIFLWFVFGLGASSEENIQIAILYSPLIVFILAPLLWLIDTFKTKISILEDGFVLDKILRRTTVRWEDIDTINRVAIFSGTFPSYGPPKDLEVRLKNSKKIRIYNFIASETDDDIFEFEQTLIDKINK